MRVSRFLVFTSKSRRLDQAAPAAGSGGSVTTATQSGQKVKGALNPGGLGVAGPFPRSFESPSVIPASG